MFEKPEVEGGSNCLQHEDMRSAPVSLSPSRVPSGSPLTESICYLDREQAKPLYRLFRVENLLKADQQA